MLTLAAQDISPAGIARIMHRAGTFADVVRLVLKAEEETGAES
jgi:hypothetical protein